MLLCTSIFVIESGSRAAVAGKSFHLPLPCSCLDTEGKEPYIEVLKDEKASEIAARPRVVEAKSEKVKCVVKV